MFAALDPKEIPPLNHLKGISEQNHFVIIPSIKSHCLFVQLWAFTNYSIARAPWNETFLFRSRHIRQGRRRACWSHETMNGTEFNGTWNDDDWMTCWNLSWQLRFVFGRLWTTNVGARRKLGLIRCQLLSRLQFCWILSSTMAGMGLKSYGT